MVEHLQDYFCFLRALKNRGRHKIFHTPLDLSVQTVLRKGVSLKRREMYGHLHYFTGETALETLRGDGLRNRGLLLHAAGEQSVFWADTAC